MKLFIIFVLLTASATATTNTTARDLFNNCRELRYATTHSLKDIPDIRSKGAEFGLCLGYMTGWLDGFSATGTLCESKVCYDSVLADDLTVGQITRVFVQYMDKHPEQENEPAVWVLTEALHDAGLYNSVKRTP